MLCRVRISKVGKQSWRMSHAVNFTLRGIKIDQNKDAGIFVGYVEIMRW